MQIKQLIQELQEFARLNPNAEVQAHEEDVQEFEIKFVCHVEYGKGDPANRLSLTLERVPYGPSGS